MAIYRRRHLLLAIALIGCHHGVKQEAFPLSSTLENVVAAYRDRGIAFQCSEQSLEIGVNEQPMSVRLCAAQVGDTGVSTWSSAGRLLGVREDRKLQPAVADSVIRTTTAQLDREFGKRKACKPGPVTATWKANDRFVAVQIWGSDVQGLPIHLAVEQTVYPRRC